MVGFSFFTCLFLKLLTLFQLQALLVVSEAELIALIYLFPLDFTMNLFSLMRLKLLVPVFLLDNGSHT